jgi:cytochrome b561
MEENRKAALRRFFSIASVVFFVIYLVFMMLSLFSFSVSTPVFLWLTLVTIFLFIIQDTVNTKVEELGYIGSWGFLSLPSFSMLMVLCYAVMAYYLQFKQRDDVLWAVCGLYDSTLLDTSLRALRKLKQNEG